MKKFLFALILAVIAVPATAQEHSHEHGSWLKPVEAEYVCMVNDTAFGKPQIPVEVDGKTYYGCCMMCKDRLEQDATIRSAVDPVSGNAVDKAEAIIGAGADNTVFYFENDENFHAYASGPMPEMHRHGGMDNMKEGMMDGDMHQHMEQMHDGNDGALSGEDTPEENHEDHH